MLTSQTVSAWSDVPAFAQRAAQNILTAAQWAKEIAHYQAVITNWKANLQNMIRDQITKLTGINMSNKFTEEYMKSLLQQRKKRCAQISNIKSQGLCRDMIDKEIEKLELYFAGEKRVESLMNQIQEKYDEYNKIQRQGGNNTEVLKTKEGEIHSLLNQINNDLAMYTQQIRLIDTKIEFMRKARVAIAKEQMTGTNAATIASKTAVIATLQSQTSDYKQDLNQKRKENAARSNQAFQSIQ